MKWSTDIARSGEIVELTADVKEVEDGTEAAVTICEYDSDGAHDKITEIPTIINDYKLKIAWEFEYHEDTDEIPTDEELKEYGGKYNPPEYFFVIDINGLKFGEDQESGLLKFKDFIEIELHDPTGKSIPNEEYTLILPDGTEREGQLDSNGHAFENDIPPGRCRLEFKNL